jgi:hypothetical protein
LRRSNISSSKAQIETAAAYWGWKQCVEILIDAGATFRDSCEPILRRYARYFATRSTKKAATLSWTPALKDLSRELMKG